MDRATDLLREISNLHLKRYEKVILIRTNILPLFMYTASTSRMPKAIKKKIKIEIAAFLFGMERRVEYEKSGRARSG